MWLSFELFHPLWAVHTVVVVPAVIVVQIVVMFPCLFLPLWGFFFFFASQQSGSRLKVHHSSMDRETANNRRLSPVFRLPEDCRSVCFRFWLILFSFFNAVLWSWHHELCQKCALGNVVKYFPLYNIWNIKNNIPGQIIHCFEAALVI